MELKSTRVTLPPRILNPKTADPVAEFSCWVKKISFRSTPMMVKYILAQTHSHKHTHTQN